MTRGPTQEKLEVENTLVHLTMVFRSIGPYTKGILFPFILVDRIFRWLEYRHDVLFCSYRMINEESFYAEEKETDNYKHSGKDFP